VYLFQFLFNTSNIVCKYTNIFPNYQIICCLFLFAEYFRQFHFDLVSTQTAGDDSAVGAEEDDFRDAGDAVSIGGNLLRILRQVRRIFNVNI